MFYAGFKKICLVLVVLSVLIFCFQDILLAKTAVIYSNGTLRLTIPDGSSTIIEQGHTMPRMPSGSIIEVLDGSIDIMTLKGFIQVVAGDSVATVKEGDRVIASVDLLENKVSFKMLSGEMEIITGNTITTLDIGQAAQIGLALKTGVVEVKSLSGIINTRTNGIRVSIPKNAIVKIDVDPKTRKVFVESISGRIQVVSTDGKIIKLAKADSVDIPGSEIGRIQTFGDETEEMESILEEEPVEPEVPEASPHRS